ncbi:MAG: response regulator transcription factor [Bacteroidetes bacterium]|nr:response regulator transcription factor [Bacteroidota bacterium]
MFRILLVDDDPTLSEITREYLEARDLSVLLCNNPANALDLLKRHHSDICLLDVKMPEIDGFTLAEEIRKKDKEIPIVFLTGQTMKEDRIRGLMLGADDYILKPYSMEELYLRVIAIMKRYKNSGTKNNIPNTYQFGKIIFHTGSREIITDNQTIRLTAIENKLLSLLCANLNGTLSRDRALQEIWGDNDIYKGRSMNVYINKLRNILKVEPDIEILNAHGEGYILSYKGSLPE